MAACAALALLALDVFLLGWLMSPLARGLRGSYFVAGRSGVEALVHERIDPNIDFSVPQKIDAAYVFHWNQKKLGDFPRDSMPPYHVQWTGLLLTPEESGTYGFALDVQGDARVILDGLPLETRPDTVTERPMTGRWHTVAIDYRLASGDARLVLSWRRPGRSLEAIPPGYFTPDMASLAYAGIPRVYGWALLAVQAFACAGIAFAARRHPESRAARWSASLAAERVTLALGAIVLLAAIVRFHEYALVPFHHETADEYQHAWEGWTLLHDGVPKAWSTFPDRYPLDQTRDFRWFGDRYILVWPYYDHPPLFSMIVGLFVSLAQPATYAPPWDFLSCTLPVMRIVPILFSLVGVVLLFHLARAYGASDRAALLAALVYATLPLLVLAHRLVKAESLLALLFMGAILAVQRHERTLRIADAVVAGVLCGLSLWTKATGVAVIVVVVVLFLRQRRMRAAVTAAAVTAGFFLLYLAYAGALDFGIFTKVIAAQASTKLVGPDSLLDLLSGKVVVRWFGRGWYLWLLLCAAWAALRRERDLLLPLAVYGTMIAMTADERVIYGWYRIPLYPFLCVAAGIALEEMLQEADLYRVFPFAITAVVTGALYAVPWVAANETGKRAMYVFALLALAPFVVRLARDVPWSRALARGAAWALLLAFFATSLLSIDRLLEIYSATRGR